MRSQLHSCLQKVRKGKSPKVPKTNMLQIVISRADGDPLESGEGSFPGNGMINDG